MIDRGGESSNNSSLTLRWKNCWCNSYSRAAWGMRLKVDFSWSPSLSSFFPCFVLFSSPRSFPWNIPLVCISFPKDYLSQTLLLGNSDLNNFILESMEINLLIRGLNQAEIRKSGCRNDFVFPYLCHSTLWTLITFEKWKKKNNIFPVYTTWYLTRY